MVGTIKKKIDEKGFGFITSSESDKDIFFHANACDGQFEVLEEGQSVRFDVEHGDKGPRAQNVASA